jgi:hypothetical protein
METQKMTHSFQHNAHDLEALFDRTNKLSTFCRKLEEQATKNTDKYPRDKYVGDGFEYFVELLFSIMPYNRKLGGIYEYQPTLVDDNGVDGVGKNWDGETCVVQVKYRSNKQTMLTGNEDHLGNLVKEATIKYRIPPHDPRKQTSKYFVVTTADSLHYYTKDEYFLGHVECIGYKQLKKLIDNNTGFWNACRRHIKVI